MIRISKGQRIGWRGALIFPSEYFDDAPPSGGGRVKVWNGSALVEKPAKHWNGSALVEKPAKHWNGASWAITA